MKTCRAGFTLGDSSLGVEASVRVMRRVVFGYAAIQIIRKRIEESFAWTKTIAGLHT